MKVSITEKQLKRLISKQVKTDFGEAESATGDKSPKSGASDNQSGGKGYPEVTTWSDTVGKELTRGVGNPIDDKTKWADDIKITRGPGNELKEQNDFDQMSNMVDGDEQKKQAELTQKKNTFDQNNFNFKIPPSTVNPNSTGILIPKTYKGITTTYSLWDNKYNPNEFFKSWVNSEWEDLIPDDKTVREMIPLNTLRSFTIGGNQYIPYIKKISDNPLRYKFMWYYDKNEKPYNVKDYLDIKNIPHEYQEKTFWENYGEMILQVGLGLVASLATFGIGGIIEASAASIFWAEAAAQAGVNISFGLYDKYKKGDDFGASMNFLFAILPFISRGLGIGYASSQSVESMKSTLELTGKETLQEFEQKITTNFEKLSPNEKVTLRKILNLEPNKVNIETRKFVNQVMNNLKNKGININDIKVSLLKKHATKDLLLQLSAGSAYGLYHTGKELYGNAAKNVNKKQTLQNLNTIDSTQANDIMRGFAQQLDTIDVSRRLGLKN